MTAPTWAILELGRRLFLRAWWMESWDDDLHWAITLLSVMDFQRWRYLHWGIPRSSMVVSFRMILHWGITISESTFIGDTVTLLDILHWDTLLSLMMDFSRWWLILRHDCFRDCACIEGWHWPCSEDTYWGIVVSLVMDFDCSLEHSHFGWFILGHSHHIHIHRARGFWFIWITLRCFRFGTKGRGWLICWLGYTILH